MYCCTITEIALISVVEARNLDTYMRSAQNYYVQVTYGKQTVKTKSFTVKPSNNPSVPSNAEWNETFLLYGFFISDIYK